MQSLTKLFIPYTWFIKVYICFDFFFSIHKKYTSIFKETSSLLTENYSKVKGVLKSF